MRRSADYKLLSIFKKFSHGGEVVGTCGNLDYSMKLSFKDDVSAPMLLSRLVSAGVPIEVLGQDGYKITWQAVLTHKPSGHVVTFYDWKGGVSWGSDVRGVEGADEGFLRDVERLLCALGNPRFPHPYDGCVVGEEA